MRTRQLTPAVSVAAVAVCKTDSPRCTGLRIEIAGMDEFMAEPWTFDVTAHQAFGTRLSLTFARTIRFDDGAEIRQQVSVFPTTDREALPLLWSSLAFGPTSDPNSLRLAGGYYLTEQAKDGFEASAALKAALVKSRIHDYEETAA